MAQKSNTVNLVIRDANGHPQMIKVVNTPSTSVSSAPQMQLNAASVFKVPAVKNPNLKLHMYQTVKVTGAKGGSRLVQLPVETITKLKQAQVLPSTSSLKKAHSSPGVIMSAPSVPSSSRQSSLYSNPSPSSSSGTSHVSTHNTRKRHETDKVSSPAYTTKRRKCADKIGKGLRHFSMKVCEKVRAKGFTSYNEVADELVAEFAAGMHISPEDQQYDQKNIRRRVYDALNVLMAMNIISKEKKEIRWLGLPTNNAQECHNLEKDKQLKLERIQQKTQHLHELILQHISFKSLVERNRTAEAKGFKPSPSSAIHLPFIVVNTSDKALIDCSISNDKTEYMFNFSEKFQIYDDIDILKRMGLLLGIDKGECTPENMAKAKAMVPKSLEHYLERLGTGQAFKASSLLEESDYEDDDDDDDEENIDEEGCKVTTEYSDGTNSDIDVN